MLRRLFNSFRGKSTAAKASAPPVRPVPTGSIASSVLAPLLRSEPKEVGELADEMEKDYQVQLAVLVLKANIQSVAVTFTPSSEDPRVVALTKQLAELWSTHLTAMLDCIGRGRVAFEKVWEYRPADNLNVIEKLDPLPFAHSEMRLGPEGQYQGVTLTIDKSTTHDLSAFKTWWLALDPTPLEPHGKSRYLGAPREVWKDRRDTRRRLAMFVNRFVVRGGVAYAPPTETDEWGRTHDAMQITQELIENMYAGGSVVFPNTWINRGTQWFREYEFTESPTTLDPSPLLAVLDAGDTAQLRSFGIPEKTLTEGDSVGSFAMVKQQTLALYAVIEGILSQCVDSFKRYIVEKSIELNWMPGDRPTIGMAFPKLTERPDSIVSQAVQGILAAGTTNDVVASGAVDLPMLFRQAGITMAPDAQQKLAAWVQAKTAAVASGGSFRRADASNAADPSSVQDLAVPADSGQVPECPSREALADAVLAELDRLYRNLSEAIESRRWDDVWPILRMIRELDVQATFASRVVGMISPWQPSLIDKPAGSGVTQHPVRELSGNPGMLDVQDLAVVAPAAAPAGGASGPGWHFPWLQAATDWLKRKRVVTASQLQNVADTERSRVFSAPGIDDRSWLNGLKQRLATSVREGRSFEDFRDDVDETLGSQGLSQPQMETLFRTNVHQAFVAGWGSITTAPIVKAEFGYVMLVATHDNRCRPTHAMMDGFICAVDDPAYDLLMRLLADYNCRCMTISLTYEQAKARGIKTIHDVPAEVLAKYGSAAMAV